MNLICFSHLRWNFVYQRPQHLLSRSSKKFQTYYVEEYVPTNLEDGYSIKQIEENLFVVIPHLCNNSTSSDSINQRLEVVLKRLFETEKLYSYLFWYYTPMALLFTENFRPSVTIYDCMDELSAFKFAPNEIKTLERKLLDKSDIVFTGGHTLYQAKKNDHKNIFPFPSSIDKAHFLKARSGKKDPVDQQNIPHPRIGFYGVIDERFDIELLKESADLKPDLHFVIIGPVVKIDPESLPQRSNIHYLGIKNYQDLPQYLSGWDISLIPFAINESTKFISPTKTPEYLCGGKRVISTPITDVVHPYGNEGLASIVNNSAELAQAVDEILLSKNDEEWLEKVDAFLENTSWDVTWDNMAAIINNQIRKKHLRTTTKKIPSLPEYMIGNSVLSDRLARKSSKTVLLLDEKSQSPRGKLRSS